MGTVFAILLGGVVAMFGILPLFSLYRQTIKAKPRFVPLDIPHLPAVQSSQIQRVVATLEKDGFTPETYLRLMDGSSTSSKYFIVLTNRADRCVALVTILTKQPTASAVATPGDLEVTFQTRFAGGTVLETHNGRRLDYTPALPNEMRNFLPSVRDLHRLYQLHCFAIEEHGLSLRQGKVIFDEGQATEFLCGMMEESCTIQEEMGYLRQNPRDGHGIYRPTWKGAYLTTWNNVFPVTVGRWIVRAVREREVLDSFQRSSWGVALPR